jgi:hypothetical protein
MLYRLHPSLAGFELTTLLVIGTDYKPIVSISKSLKKLLPACLRDPHFVLKANPLGVYGTVYRLHPSLAGFELTTLLVIGTDCTGSCKSNHRTIMTTTALDITIKICVQLKVKYKQNLCNMF